MKLATWNVNSLRARLDHLQRWLAIGSPDVLCMQEIKLTDDLFPADVLAAWGYPHQATWGERTYTGVAIASRFPLAGVSRGFGDGGDDVQARFLSAVVGGVRIANCYVPNGSEVGSPKFAYKLQWLERLRAWLERTATPDAPLAVVGDMNVALEDADVWDPFKCEGRVLYHPAERERVQRVLEWGLVDAFRTRHPFASQFTWWDYRSMGFVRNQGLRIDHVFLTRSLDARCRSIAVFRDVRGWDQPSDHVPVQADLAGP